jgi:integrase
MASIRDSRGEGYVICFRYGNRQFNRKLGTDCPKEADARKKRVECTLHDLATGRLTLPTDCRDVGLFILSDGKVAAKPDLPRHVTLVELWQRYLDETPEGAKDQSTRDTEGLHFRHLLQLLKGGRPVELLTTADLQRYIKTRTKAPGIRGETVKPRTVRKELDTLRAIWNGFALPHKIVAADFRAHFGKLVYPKEKSKPPFQTYDQIKKQLAGKTPAEQAELWDGLFLQKHELADLLEIVRLAQAPAWLHPMVLLAAHTGARRGELMRAEPHDFDLDGRVWHVREKKRDRRKKFTYRVVSLSTPLVAVLRDWQATREPGQFMFGDLTRRVVQYGLERVVAGTPWSCIRGWHLFRHSFVSILAVEGKDQRMIDAMTGHQTEEMRARYRHLAPSSRQAALDSVFG